MHVLLVEDNPGDAKLVQMALKAETMVEFNIVHVETLARAKECLAKGGIDAVLLDLSLPDSFGMKTIRAVMEAAPKVPIIVLTGLDDAEVGYKSVVEGAQDYLVKGHADGDQLRRAILYSEYRKHAQQTIESLNLRLDHILSSLGEGVVGIGLDGKVVFHNPEVLRMCELSPGDLENVVPQVALGEVDRHGVSSSFEASAIARTLQDGKVRHVSDTCLTRSDGALVPVDYIVTPMKDGETIEGAVVAYRDVSDREQAFDVLKRQLDFHQRMIDALPQPIFYLDRDFTMLGCNAVFEKEGGVAALSILGKFALEVLPDRLSSALEGALDSLQSGQVCLAEITGDGGSILKVTPIVGDDGTVLGFAGTLLKK
jgi:PAS domain S-box-containing protein